MSEQDPLKLVGCKVERQAPGWTERGTITGVLPAYASPSLFTLQASSKSEWFSFYREMITELWEESEELSPQ